jgi:succinate dehydrogenase / fumarate reductase flavoprotein subunit
MQIRAFRGDAVVMATGGQRADLRAVHQLGDLHRRGRQPLLPGRRVVRQRRDDPGPPDRHPRRRQVPAHERVRPRRGRPRLGAPQAGRHRPPRRSPRTSAGTSSRRSTPLRQPRAPRHRDPRDLRRLRQRRVGIGGGTWSTSTSPTRTPTTSTDQARRHHGDLREVRGDDPRNVPMKIFPAVHYTMGGHVDARLYTPSSVTATQAGR